MRTEEHAEELTRRLSGSALVKVNEALARKTTLRVGGPADLYVEPASEDDLSIVLAHCHGNGLPFFVLGRGSNLLVRDHGFRGLVICLAQPFFSRIEVSGVRLRCGAGAKVKAVAVEAKRSGISGLEFLEGIPGTVGGALRMNAGAMGAATFDMVESVRVMDSTGHAVEKSARELKVAYRSCPELAESIALGAVFRGQAALRPAIEKRMKEFSQKRWASQPAAPSAGCIFKNPPSIPAGKLIDELGLKGTRVGGAFVSTEHGNFIVNDGTATAADVLALIAVIQERAKAERAVTLETEVEIIGE